MNESFGAHDILKAVARPADPEHKPGTISELGVRESILEDIALKTLYLHGHSRFSILRYKHSSTTRSQNNYSRG